MFSRALLRQVAARPCAIPARGFASSLVARNGKSSPNLPEIKSAEDLLPAGAERGTMPTDLEQSTGLERLEILSKMAGVDIFDMQPIKITKLGTVKEPVVVDSLDTHRYVGCTGEHESHETLWITVEQNKQARCPECGSVYKLNYIGNPDAHGHH